MTSGYRVRYTEKCAFTRCNSYRRDGDVFCGPHYFSLPDHIKHGLWSKDHKQFGEAIAAAKQWLQDKVDNALIVKEEGP